MIRPFTCLAMLMAAGSGLYLYQAKHQGVMLDQQIDEITTATKHLREHIAVLRAEYALLSDPTRLQQLAGADLPRLVPLAPGQFTTLAQLDSRLPPVRQAAPPPAPTDDAAPPMFDVAAPGGIGVRTGSVPYDFPPAPQPAKTSALVAAAVPAVAPAHPAAAPHRPRPVVVAAVARLQPRHAAEAAPPPLEIPAAAPPSANPGQVASALGMARGLVGPASYSYQRYRPGDAEMLAR